jgi:catechol-2,3-dioxygenase
MSISRQLGEIALRVQDMATMTAFYRDVIGLEQMTYDGDIVFFKIAEGFAGHTQVLALFHALIDPNAGGRFTGYDPGKTTLHHLAFSVTLDDLIREQTRLENLGLAVRTAVHEWVQWRSVYVSDPEGNTVELVAYDETIEQVRA